MIWCHASHDTSGGAVGTPLPREENYSVGFSKTPRKVSTRGTYFGGVTYSGLSCRREPTIALFFFFLFLCWSARVIETLAVVFFCGTVHRSPARPSQGELSPEEVDVLKDSSRVNGKLFLPWIAQDLQVGVLWRFRFAAANRPGLRTWRKYVYHTGPR